LRIAFTTAAAACSGGGTISLHPEKIACLYRPLTIAAQASSLAGHASGRGELAAMRVQGLSGAALATAKGGVRRAGSGNFSVSEDEAPHGSVASTNLRAISTVDALIALQAVEDPAERRKRAVRHGRRALDELDALKVGLLDGTVDQSTLARLKVVADGLDQSSGDPGLDIILNEIGLRVAVELAKADSR
jgi:hypothetical protein